MDSLLDRITIDPNICHGKPCVRSLRYPVEAILELLSSGVSTEEILEDYEDLEREDILPPSPLLSASSSRRRALPPEINSLPDPPPVDNLLWWCDVARYARSHDRPAR